METIPLGTNVETSKRPYKDYSKRPCKDYGASERVAVCVSMSVWGVYYIM